MSSEPDISSPNYGQQRRTSNFFPSESTPALPDYAKRHNSSPLIGSHNTQSKFFTTSEPLTPFLRSSSSTSTPHNGMDIGLELSNNLNGLNLFGSTSSNFPKYGKSYGTTSGANLTSPPNSSGSILNLTTSAGGTSSGSVTPSMLSSSIWNDNNVGGTAFHKLTTLEEFIRQEEETTKINMGSDFAYDYKYDDPYNSSFEEGVSYGAPMYQEDDAIKNSERYGDVMRDSYPNEFLYSPFSSETTSPTAIRLQLKKANIYLSRVNNPSFVPNTLEESPAIMEKSESEAKVEKMRDFLKQHPPKKPSKNNLASPLPSAAPFNLQESLNRIKRLEERSFHKREEKDHDDPMDAPKVRLRLNRTPNANTPNNDDFTNEILRNDNHTNSYSEDYCSQFYKRNSHGYMFIKEPTNSLKVNATGSKSWVQLKIKLPSDSDPVVRKLKVDIKELPIWKPINLNGTSPVSTLKRPKYKERKKNVNVSRRFGMNPNE